MGSRYWLGTIAVSAGWVPPTEVVAPLVWLRGQQELGEGGFEHFQVFASFSKPQRLRAVKGLLGAPTGHFEPSRSVAAEEYVWKEDTRVEG